MPSVKTSLSSTLTACGALWWLASCAPVRHAEGPAGASKPAAASGSAASSSASPKQTPPRVHHLNVNDIPEMVRVSVLKPDALAATEANATAHCNKDGIFCYWAGAFYTAEALKDGGKTGAGAKARRWLEKGCEERKDQPSCLLLGEELLKGRAFLRDEAKGEAVLTQSCREGFLPACEKLGRQVIHKAAEQKSLPLLQEGIGTLRKAVYGGRPEATPAYMAAMTVYKLMSGQKEALQNPHLRARCNEGEGEACVLVAMTGGKHTGAAAEKISLLEKACALRDAVGCSTAGHFLIQEQHAIEKGVSYLEKGCAMGNQLACFSLASADPKDTVIFTEERRQSFKKGADSACRAGIGQACYTALTLSRRRKQENKVEKTLFSETMAGVGRACAMHEPSACFLFLTMTVGVPVGGK